jgi:hypothetical protein
MSDEAKLEQFRRWALAVLNLAGSPPALQVKYARTSHVGVDEIVHQLGDVFNVAQARLADGSLDIGEFRWFDAVIRQASEIDSSSEDLWNEEAVFSSTPWKDLRNSAVRAKAELDLLWGAGP